MKPKALHRARWRILFWILWNFTRILPYRVATDLLAFIGRAWASFFTRQDIISANLANAFPEQSAKWVKQTALLVASNFGRFAAEVCHLDHIRDKCTVTFSGKEQIAIEGHRPQIFVSSHVCNWEIVPLLFKRSGIEVTIIYTKFKAPYMDRKVLAMRRMTGADYVEKNQAVRSSFQAMKKGRSVALLVDQRVPTGIEVEFFGRRTIVTNLPARLALRFGAQIVPVEVQRRSKDHFHVVFGEAIVMANDGGDSAESAITQRMMNSIEATIRRSPSLWFCNTRRWTEH